MANLSVMRAASTSLSGSATAASAAASHSSQCVEKRATLSAPLITRCGIRHCQGSATKLEQEGGKTSTVEGIALDVESGHSWSTKRTLAGYGQLQREIGLRSIFHGRGIDLERPEPFQIKWRCTGYGRKSKAFPKWFCKRAPVEILPEARCMEEVYDALAERLLEAALRTPPKKKHMVALAGTPGAGKSTVANAVCDRVNRLAALHPALKKHEVGGGNPGEIHPDSNLAIAVPMDGFHLYRWQLDQMEDPEEAHARRGAPWTFNPRGLVDHLKRIRQEGKGYLPSFDHCVGDPVEEDIFIAPHHRVVVVEGNYMLLAEGEWSELQPLFDELWYLKCDIDEAMDRVQKRHIGTGKTQEVAKWRVDYNDRPNAELVALTSQDADIIIPSVTIV